jgi:hypothetical protein
MTEDAIPDEGGEGACFAHLICPECGAVLDGSEHGSGCAWVDPGREITPMDDLETGS